MQHIDYQGSRMNFQVRLYEVDDRIEFVYGNMNGFNGTVNDYATYTVGLSGSVSGIVFNQNIANQLSFTTVTSTNLSEIPACNSMITFTPSANSIIYAVTVPSPINDNCIGATLVPVTNGFSPNYCDVFSSKYATTSTGFSPNTLAGFASDVWFKFTVPSISGYNIAVIPSGDYNGNFELFSGGCASTLTSMNFVSFGSTGKTNTYTTTLSGGTYFFRVFDNRGIATGSSDDVFNISVYETALPPSNDNCSGAKPITIGTLLSSGNTSNATLSLTMPSTCNNGVADDDVWYVLTATSPITSVTVAGSINYSPNVSVFEGGCPTTATSSISCSRKVAGEKLTINYTNLSVGGLYFLRVFHDPLGGTPTEGFTIYTNTPKPNCPNLISTASVLTATSDIILSWNNVSNPSADGYLVEVSSDNFATVTVSGTTSGLDFTILAGNLTEGLTYKWKVTSFNINGYSNGNCGFLQFDTYSTKPSCPTLTSPSNTENGVDLVQNLAWNSGLNNVNFTLSINGASFNNIVTNTYPITLTAGLNYNWTITPYNGIGESPLQVCPSYSFQTIAANDNFSTAYHLLFNSTATFSGLNATNSSITGCTGIADDDLWFVITAQPSNFIKATGGSQYNAVIEVFTLSGNNLTSLNCFNNYGKGESEKAFVTGLISGSIYYVRVFNSGIGASITPNLKVEYSSGATLNPLSASSYCAGESASATYSFDYVTNGDINIELSDGNGSFTSPTILASSTLLGTNLTFTIPLSISSGLNYKLKINNVSNSIVSSSFTLNGKVADAQSITTSSVLSVGKQGVVMNVPASSNADSYIWTLPSGVQAVGNSLTTTGNSITINLPANSITGTITVKGANSCFVGTESSYSLVVNSLSVTGIASILSDNISIFPNPTLRNVSIKTGIELGKTTVTISDLAGKKIHSTQIDLISVYELSISDLIAGVYFLTLETEKGKFVTRLIKQ